MNEHSNDSLAYIYLLKVWKTLIKPKKLQKFITEFQKYEKWLLYFTISVELENHNKIQDSWKDESNLNNFQSSDLLFYSSVDFC